jgi:hypothetical protein
MTLKEQVQILSDSQRCLRQVQNQLSQQTALMKKEENQLFIFELRDYVDSLSLVTDYVEKTTPRSVESTTISALLSEQNQFIRTLIHNIQQLEEEDGDFFGQKEGELRRTLIGLQGILELNELLLQDNFIFQKQLTDASAELTSVAEETKGGFFQRFFVKKGG